MASTRIYEPRPVPSSILFPGPVSWLHNGLLSPALPLREGEKRPFNVAAALSVRHVPSTVKAYRVHHRFTLISTLPLWEGRNGRAKAKRISGRGKRQASSLSVADEICTSLAKAASQQ